jgi:hypothetical protein
MNIIGKLKNKGILKIYEYKNGNGKNIYTEKEINILIDEAEKLIKSKIGGIEMGSGSIITIDEIKVNDRIEFLGKEYKIVKVDIMRKKGRVVYYEGVIL